MSLYLEKSQTLFLHIPRTGGTWFEQVLNLNDVDHHRVICRRHEVAKMHAPLVEIDRSEQKSLKSISFIREPVAYYESIWRCFHWKWGDPERPSIDRFRRRYHSRWHPFKPLFRLYDANFGTFVENCLREEPGFVTRLYEWFLGPPGIDWIDLVLKTEEISKTVPQLLAQLGEIDLDDWEGMPSANSAPHVSCRWDSEVRSRVELSEAAGTRRWGQAWS